MTAFVPSPYRIACVSREREALAAARTATNVKICTGRRQLDHLLLLLIKRLASVSSSLISRKAEPVNCLYQ